MKTDTGPLSRSGIATWCIRVAALVCISAVAAECAAQPQELRLAEKAWGFDGRVAQGQFNPLSVLVDNLSDQPIEGVVTLRPVSGMLREGGGVLTAPLYLAPNTRRWVQFYPYINRHSSSWRLTIKTDERTIHSETIDQPRSIYDLNSDESMSRRHPAVILDKSSMASRLPTSVKHMSDEIFPPYSTATAALRVLFLDHVPDWEAPRQAALLSWLRLGGQLHLLQDSNGLALQFSGILSPLNEPFSEFPVGSGKVVRHTLQREGLTDAIAGPLIDRAKQSGDADIQRQINAAQYQMSNTTLDPGSSDADMLADMRSLTQPEHAWWLILLLSLAYIGMIFPGCWILSQKRSVHYLATYGAIAGLAIVFSILFLVIGRRGYGESTVMHSVAIARSDDATHWNTLQWNSLFVTAGDNYLLRMDDQQAMIASGNSEERVDAYIECGSSGRFDVRIPPFSSQSMLSRRTIAAPDWELSVRTAEVSSTSLVKLELSVGKDFPAGKDCRYMVLYHDTLYSASLGAGKDTLTSLGSIRKLPDFCAQRPQQAYNGGFFFNPVVRDEHDQRTPVQRFYDDSIHLLVGRSLLDDGVRQTLDFILPADRVRLLVYAPMPESFEIPVSKPTRHEGWVLYVRDVLLQSN